MSHVFRSYAARSVLADGAALYTAAKRLGHRAGASYLLDFRHAAGRRRLLPSSHNPSQSASHSPSSPCSSNPTSSTARTPAPRQSNELCARLSPQAPPAVANIYTERVFNAPRNDRGLTFRGQKLGSGVVIDRARLRRHQLARRFATPTRFACNWPTAASPCRKLVGADPETELALLKIDLPNLPEIRLGRSDTLEVGDVVLAIGNSLGLSQTVTMGIVSATGRGQLGVTTFEDFIQTDAAINAGNSGGALVNARGELVGINTAVISTAGDQTMPEGLGFAIPVNLVRGVMQQLDRARPRDPRLSWASMSRSTCRRAKPACSASTARPC